VGGDGRLVRRWRVVVIIDGDEPTQRRLASAPLRRMSPSWGRRGGALIVSLTVRTEDGPNAAADLAVEALRTAEIPATLVRTAPL